MLQSALLNSDTNTAKEIQMKIDEIKGKMIQMIFWIRYVAISAQCLWFLIGVFSGGHDDDDWLFSIQITWAGAGWEEACWANGP